MSSKIAAALHEVMSKVGYVQKTGKNQFHGYRYAGEADLLDKLRPAMVEAGLMLLPSVENVSPIDEHGNVTVIMSYTLLHKDGEKWPDKLTAVGCGNDRSNKGTVGDKGVYKAITGANKYLLFKLFQIETGDDPENDANSPDPHARAPANNKTPPKPADAPDEATVKGARQRLTEAAERGTEAFREAWKHTPPAVRAVTTKDEMARWKATAEETDALAEKEAA